MTSDGASTSPLPVPDHVGERVLEVSTGADKPDRVTLRVAAPERDPLPGGDWRCRYAVLGLGDPVLRYAYGVDTLQALQLAMAGLANHVRAQAVELGAELSWIGGEDLGLPKPSWDTQDSETTP